MEEVHQLDEHSFRRRKNFYQRHDPFTELNEQEFRHKYRMKKSSFRRLLDILRTQLEETHDPRATPPHMQLLIALRFYAVDTFHYVTGDLMGFSAGHVCKIVA